jgi:hypothetical protein
MARGHDRGFIAASGQGQAGGTTLPTMLHCCPWIPCCDRIHAKIRRACARASRRACYNCDVAKFRRGRWYGPFPYNGYGIEDLRSQMNAPLAGAYLVRLRQATILYPFRRDSIIYLGKAKDIDIRLEQHLSPFDGNNALYNYLVSLPCTFQFRKCNMNGARSLEREFLEWCLDRLGSKPICNSQL